MQIPIVNLQAAIEETRSAWQSRIEQLFAKSHFVLGEQVISFEQEFASYLGARYSIGVGNGTDAIELCVRDSGICGEVLTSALTSPFSATALQSAGVNVRFVDVDPDTLQMSAKDVEESFTRRTRGVLAVHLYGQCCDLAAISTTCQNQGLTLFQDACQAHGCRLDGDVPFTELGEYVAYSFYPTKNLGCLGDGGAVVTNSSRVNRRVRLLRDGGRRGGQVSYVRGCNSRLDEMQACYLRSFLPCLNDWNQRRRRIAALYDDALQGCSGIRPVIRKPWSVCHLYVLRVEKRDHLREFLAAVGIATGIHYPVPLHLHPAFRECDQRKGSLPVAEKACKEILSLPLWPHMPEAAALFVAEKVCSFYH